MPQSWKLWAACAAIVLAIVIAVAGVAQWWSVAIVGLAVLGLGTTLHLLDLRGLVVRRSELRLELTRAHAHSNLPERLTIELRGQVDRLARELTLVADRVEAVRAAVIGHDADSAKRETRSRVLAVRRTEALLQLYSLVDLRAPMPLTGGWAMDADNLLELVELTLQRRPRLVVELGSGVSTIWLGYLLQRQQTSRLVSLDHDTEFAQVTRDLVSEHGLDDVVEVRTTALANTGLNGHEPYWYSQDGWKDLEAIDLLLVDGPPQAVGAQARYPALPLLSGKLSANSVVLVDDAHRPGETDMVQRWIDEIPGLRQRQVLNTQVAILELGDRSRTNHGSNGTKP